MIQLLHSLIGIYRRRFINSIFLKSILCEHFGRGLRMVFNLKESRIVMYNGVPNLTMENERKVALNIFP